MRECVLALVLPILADIRNWAKVVKESAARAD
jgi:hypothetical protein